MGEAKRNTFKGDRRRKKKHPPTSEKSSILGLTPSCPRPEGHVPPLDWVETLTCWTPHIDGETNTERSRTLEDREPDRLAEDSVCRHDEVFTLQTAVQRFTAAV